MNVEKSVNALVERLTHVRSTVLRRREELLAADPRIDDIVWPCAQHEHVAAGDFDSPNTCLVAEPSVSTLWVSRPVLQDIATLMPQGLRPLAAEWFFLHQMVHVAQGLGYHDFRTLNRVGNRHETMRPDCEADLTSLKTLAWLMADGDTDPGDAGLAPAGYLACFAYLVDVVVPEMMQLEPNIFIPRRREIELKRMFALLILRHYVARATDAGDPVPDGSFFPWWTEDRTQLYVFVGQVHTLGRGALTIDADLLSSVLTSLEAGAIDTAYEQVARFDWPRLNESALPRRLLHEPSRTGR